MLLWTGELQIGKRRNTKDDAPSIKVSYHPELLMGLRWPHELILEGYERNFMFNPSVTQTCFMPEWLIEYGVRHEYEKWCVGTESKPKPQAKRKKRALSNGDDTMTSKRARAVVDEVEPGPTSALGQLVAEGKRDAFIPQKVHFDDELPAFERLFSCGKPTPALQDLDFDDGSSGEDESRHATGNDATVTRATVTPRDIKRAINLNRIHAGEKHFLIE